MSEHWKSTPKYWCKHCSTYVKDTPFEKKQHEATGKHQGNLRRFLNGIQKDHAKNERERNQAKAEVQRLNRIAGASSSSSSTATTSSGASSSQTASKTTKATSTNLSAVDQKRQWAQLADMGIAIPENAGVDNAAPGGWQTVSRKVIDESAQSPDDKLNIGVRKRKFENENEEEEEDAGETVVRRGWGSNTKTYPGSAPTHNDLDALLAASVFKRKEIFKQPAEEDSKRIASSIPESSDVAADAEKGQETKSIPLERALTGTSTSAVLEPVEEEDKSLVLQSSGLETAIPVFKKRKPRK